MKTSPEIMIIRETVKESWLSDASSVVSVVCLIGIGMLLRSEPMQWLGAVLGFLTILGKAVARNKRLTIAEARQRLNEIEKTFEAKE